MAVVTVKSAPITNRDATPAVLNNPFVDGARIKHVRGVAAIANGDSIGSKYIFGQLPSGALPISVRVSSPDIGTTTTGHLGLSKNTKDGSAVVDADFFKATLSLKDGAISKAEHVMSNVITIANGEKRIWEHLALTADPFLVYDVVLTLDAASDGAGSVLVEIDYVD